MVACSESSPAHVTLPQLQARFLSILPKIKTHAQIYFCHVKCCFKKTDFVAEVVALSWKWFLRLHEQGKDATEFPSVLASYAAKAVRSGRRVCGQLKSKDVLSESAQQRHSFTVSKLPDYSTLHTNPLVEALTDNTQSPVPDQVQFRLDFPDWLTTHCQRNRSIAVEMAQGERTQALAGRFKLSPARISQLRSQFHESWCQFTDS